MHCLYDICEVPFCDLNSLPLPTAAFLCHFKPHNVHVAEYVEFLTCIIRCIHERVRNRKEMGLVFHKVSRLQTLNYQFFTDDWDSEFNRLPNSLSVLFNCSFVGNYEVYIFMHQGIHSSTSFSNSSGNFVPIEVTCHGDDDSFECTVLGCHTGKQQCRKFDQRMWNGKKTLTGCNVLSHIQT